MENELTPKDLLLAGVAYLQAALEQEVQRFNSAEEKAFKYAQALAILVGTAVVGAEKARQAFAPPLSSFAVLFIIGYGAAALATVVALVASAAALRVEGMAAMPVDADTIRAIKEGEPESVISSLIDRYGTTLSQIRVLNERRFRWIRKAFWATFVAFIAATVAVVGYVLK